MARECWRVNRECTDKCEAFRSAFSKEEQEKRRKNHEKSNPLPPSLPLMAPGGFYLGETYCLDLYHRNQTVLFRAEKLKRNK